MVKRMVPTLPDWLRSGALAVRRWLQRPRFEPVMPGTLSGDDRARLDAFYLDVEQQTATFAGYPCTDNFDYRELFRFLSFPLNNVGDPFNTCIYNLHTCEFECEVVEWFARLMPAPNEKWWGYVTNGCTLHTNCIPRAWCIFSRTRITA